MAFSAIGFLFLFLVRPNSNEILYLLSKQSSERAVKPGAQSVRTTILGPSNGCKSITRRNKASRKVLLDSFSISVETVYEVTYSRKTRTS